MDDLFGRYWMQGVEDPQKQLDSAIRSKKIEKIQEALKNGAQIVNNATKKGVRAYHHDSLYTALMVAADISIITLLLNEGAKIVNDSINERGERYYFNDTLYHALEHHASIDVIALLMERGAEIVNYPRNRDGGNMPYCDTMYRSVMHYPNNLELLAFFLERGAQIVNDSTDKEGNRLYHGDTLHCAYNHQASPEVNDLLLLWGADPAVLPSGPEGFPHREFLIQRKGEIDRGEIADSPNLQNFARRRDQAINNSKAITNKENEKTTRRIFNEGNEETSRLNILPRSVLVHIAGYSIEDYVIKIAKETIKLTPQEQLQSIIKILESEEKEQSHEKSYAAVASPELIVEFEERQKKEPSSILECEGKQAFPLIKGAYNERKSK